MAKKNLTADQLIAVARELSNTQTQIEESSRTQAGLKHRIDTDLLNINFGVPPEEYSGQYTPITDSIKYFGNHFRSAISAVIDFFAYFLPWIPVIVLGFLGVRKMWQLIRKKPASTSST